MVWINKIAFISRIILYFSIYDHVNVYLKIILAISNIYNNVVCRGMHVHNYNHFLYACMLASKAFFISPLACFLCTSEVKTI